MILSKHKKYKNIENSIIKAGQEINHYLELGLNGVPLVFVLSLLPDETIVNIHIQSYSFTNVIRSADLRRVTVEEARNVLTREEKLMKAMSVVLDYDYGYNKKCPVAIIEVPCKKCKNK